jgi:hypothetical protein
MAVEGRLNELSLTTLIQMACQEGGTARLTLDRDGEQATLYFDAGTIVHAATGERNGEEAVYHILTWQDGTFSLEPGVGPPGRSVHTHWSALLMDGLQQVDETRWDDGTHLVEEPFTLPENVQDILRELSTQVEGFVVASLVGMDSIPIAQHESAGVDVEAINAQMTLLVKLVDTSVNRLAAGTLLPAAAPAGGRAALPGPGRRSQAIQPGPPAAQQPRLYPAHRAGARLKPVARN